MTSSSWQIILFESKRGEKLVEEFVRSLDQTTIAKILHEVNLLEQHGALLGMPHAKKIESGLYELRIRGKVDVRILYIIKGRKIYLLHCFKKKKQKIPSKEISIALKRIKEIS